MPTINLSKKHGKSSAEIKHQENNDTLTFTRLDMSGELCLMPNEVSVTVKTGFLTAAFTPVIESELKRTLDKYLA